MKKESKSNGLVCPRCSQPHEKNHKSFLCDSCERLLMAGTIVISDECVELLQEFLVQVVPWAQYISLVRHGGDVLVCVNDKTVTCNAASVQKRLAKKASQTA